MHATLLALALPGFLAQPELPELRPARRVDLVWPIPFDARLSWATTSAPNPTGNQNSGRIFLLRGTGIVFSPEFGTLCTRLRQAGLWAEDLCSSGDHWVCQRLMAERRAGRLGGPIILIGHSRGGRHILHAARDLEKAGIAVDLVVCLDVAMPPAVPGNVGSAMNVYLTRHRVYPAGKLTSAPGSAARIENVDLSKSSTLIGAPGLHHLNITASPVVQDLVVQRILQVAQNTPAR